MSEPKGPSAEAALELGVVLARRVVANWSAGDLAAAVNALEEWADEVADDFPALDFADDDEESDDDDDADSPYCTGCGADLRGEDHKDSCDLDDDAKAATLARHRPAPKEWESVERAPGEWIVTRNGERYGGTGPWTNKAAADKALGYLAWVAAGGSAD
jgi:hypothetical protein